METHGTVSVTINRILNILRDTCKKTCKVASKTFILMISEACCVRWALFSFLLYRKASQTEFPHCTNNSFVLSVTRPCAAGVEVCSRTSIGYRKLNWLNLTFGAADEHNGRWVFSGFCILRFIVNPLHNCSSVHTALFAIHFIISIPI